MSNPKNQRGPYEPLTDRQFHEANCSACLKGTPTKSCPGYQPTEEKEDD